MKQYNWWRPGLCGSITGQLTGSSVSLGESRPASITPAGDTFVQLYGAVLQGMLLRPDSAIFNAAEITERAAVIADEAMEQLTLRGFSS